MWLVRWYLYLSFNCTSISCMLGYQNRAIRNGVPRYCILYYRFYRISTLTHAIYRKYEDVTWIFLLMPNSYCNMFFHLFVILYFSSSYLKCIYESQKVILIEKYALCLWKWPASWMATRFEENSCLFVMLLLSLYVCTQAFFY